MKMAFTISLLFQPNILYFSYKLQSYIDTFSFSKSSLLHIYYSSQNKSITPLQEQTSIIIRKLKHADKAWKSIKSHIESKLHKNPKFVKTIKTLRQHFVIPRRSFMYKRSHIMTKPFPSPSQYSLHQSRYSAIYVDELFPGFVSSDHHRNPKKAVMKENNDCDYDQPMQRRSHGVEEDVSMIKVSTDSSDKGSGKGKAKAGERSKSVCASSADKWRVPSLPQFRDIDERAEEFIRKFRQDMKLEREQSILDFQEMLKRSA